MKKNPPATKPDEASAHPANNRVTLRQKAEAKLRERLARSGENIESLSHEDLRTILHELRVHQIELEMQNDELIQAEAKLSTSRARYFDLYDLAPVGYVSLNGHGLIIETNLAAATLLGLHRSALVNKPFSLFIFREDQDSFYHLERRMRETGASQSCELRMVNSDSAVFWARLNASASRDESGAPVSRVSLADITEVKRAADEIAASEEKFRQLFQGSRDALMMATPPEWRFTSANPATLTLFGAKSEEEFLACTPLDLSPELQPDGRASNEKASELIGTALREGGNSFEWRHRKLCGDEFDADVLLTHVRRNGASALQATVRDITARKATENELITLRTAVAQSGNSIIVTKRDGSIEYVNSAFEKVTGYRSDEVVGKNPRFLKSGEQDAAFYAGLWATITSGKIWRGEFHNLSKSRLLFWEAATISPIVNDREEIVHFLAIKEDITERKALEASLHDALVHAQAAAVSKSEFLSVMSHELRTPLNGVLGFADLLADTSLDAEQRSCIETIQSSGQHLLAVVNDILDFSSIEHGTLTVYSSPIVLAELVKSAEDTVGNIAADKALEFRCEIDSASPALISGDERRIRQILINLLANAVKFTCAGSVILRITPAQQGRFLDFSVHDSGIGMAPETIEHLFKPFAQADSTMSRRFGGTALGLAISKRLAEAMNGMISVVSSPGQGSTFTFRLPLQVPTGDIAQPSELCVNSASIPDEAPPSSTDSSLVLVVEDDPTSRRLVGKMISNLGLRVEFATNGVEAVKAFVSGKFSAIFMDMAMPVMGGLAATQEIREAEKESREHVRIIALTANVMPGDHERCLEAGMDDFLSKPLKKGDLVAKLTGISGIKTINTPMTSSRPS